MSARSTPPGRDGELRIDGHRMVYRDSGPTDGPVVVLLHGMVSDGSTWARAADRLSQRGFRVLVPDLIGHGRSDKPRAGYSIPGFARHARQLLDHLHLTSATVVGHSYGGAVAIVMAHDHPQHVQRLVLVAAGGLGREIHPVFRVATLPGASTVLGLVVNPRTALLVRHPRLHRSLRLSTDAVENLSRAGRGLASREGRHAFFSTLRSAIRPSGQIASMLELGYLNPRLPVLMVWSENDPVVPLSHARRAHETLPNSRLLVLPGSTHQPHHHSADAFADAVSELIADTATAITQPGPDPR